MDEWDEFLLKASEDSTLNSMDTDEVIAERCELKVSEGHLEDFGDNAEVLIQRSRGETITEMSSNGIWINSDSNPCGAVKPTQSSSYNLPHQSFKRSLKNGGITPAAIPVANTFQDFSQALTGHPLLSHPMGLLRKKQSGSVDPDGFEEIDSLGLFFYAKTGGNSVQIESNFKDDFSKVIEIKQILMQKSILNHKININSDGDGDGGSEGLFSSEMAQFIISFEALKVLSNSIPPNGKSTWLLPFEITPTGSVLMTHSPILTNNTSNTELFFEFAQKSIESHLSGLINETEHLITFTDEDNLKFIIKTKSPNCNILANFRGNTHCDPTNDLVNFIFSRQSNYSIELDFETLKVVSIKSFVPKFDPQNRLLLLLKALGTKLMSLNPGRYYLSHTANCPFIKVNRSKTE